MELAYDTRMFQELTTDEMMEVDGGVIGTLIVGAGYVIVKVGGVAVAKFVGLTAIAAAITWVVNKGMDWAFG